MTLFYTAVSNIVIILPSRIAPMLFIVNGDFRQKKYSVLLARTADSIKSRLGSFHTPSQAF